jgi:hypothetical protein
MNSRKSKRVQLFGAACFGFLVCSFLLWKLATDNRGDKATIYAGWILIPLGLSITTWLAVSCIRKKENDTFYDRFDGD